MFPFPMFLLYALAAYLIWWVISRLSLLGAWLYSKPGSFTLRHYIFTFISACPLLMEMMATTLVIFSVAYGFDPHARRE